MNHHSAPDAFVAQHPHSDKGWAMTAADAPASRWRRNLLAPWPSAARQPAARSTTFEELCPAGVVAPPHIHDNEEEAFFILEGDLTFLLDDQETFRPAGTYVYIAPGTLHGFCCDSAVGPVFDTLIPGGFDHGITENCVPATQVAMRPTRVPAL